VGPRGAAESDRPEDVPVVGFGHVSQAPRLAGFIDRQVPVLLGICAVTSLALFVLRPIDNAHEWAMAPTMTAALIGIWFVYRHRPEWFAGNRWLLGSILIAGLIVAVNELTSLHKGGEVIDVYRALFDALDRGINPYDCNCIPHIVEGGTKLGNFNYPPTEIWPYYLVHSVLGVWNRYVFSAVLIALNIGTCLALRLTFRRLPWRVIACYFPFLIFFGLETNSATALFMISLAVALITRLGAGDMGREALLVVTFGVGILTKFIVIPVFAAFYWGRVRWRAPRTVVRCMTCALAVVALAIALMVPFGVGNVWRETVLFNLTLDTRAELTTYYPNVLSGALRALSLDHLYPLVAVLVLAASVLVAPLYRTLSGILAAAVTFMFVASTPEPQFLPIILYLAIAGTFARGIEVTEVTENGLPGGRPSTPLLSAAPR
jgi:hypothetical protein